MKSTKSILFVISVWFCFPPLTRADNTLEQPASDVLKKGAAEFTSGNGVVEAYAVFPGQIDNVNDLNIHVGVLNLSSKIVAIGFSTSLHGMSLSFFRNGIPLVAKDDYKRISGGGLGFMKIGLKPNMLIDGVIKLSDYFPVDGEGEYRFVIAWHNLVHPDSLSETTLPPDLVLKGSFLLKRGEVGYVLSEK